MSRLFGVKDIEAFIGPQDQLEKLIDWRAGSVAVLKHYKLDTVTKGDYMQRSFTIELRVDFADRDKLPELRQALLQCARRAYSNAQLLSDTPKTTDISIWSEDFFTPREEIALLEDILNAPEGATNEVPDEATSDDASKYDDLAKAITG